MEKRPTATIEDYLGIMYTLERDGEKIIGARLAEILHVSPPTVTVTLKRMIRDGWIEINNKQVCLTQTGKEAARSVIRRHMLTEWLLSRVLDIPWSDLHDEAHKIEHSLSKKVENKLAATLDDPEACPHGNPLPGQEELSKDWVPITEFSENEVCTIRRIHEFLEEDKNIMQFLADNMILPGCKLEIQSINLKKQRVIGKVKKKQVVIPFEIAGKLFAE